MRTLLIVTYLVFTVLVSAEEFPLGNGYLPDELSLSHVTFLGAHNSPMSKADRWVYYQQNVNLEDQFNLYGVRAFKVNWHWFNPNSSYLWSSDPSNAPFIALCHEPGRGGNCPVTTYQRQYLSNPEPALDQLIQLRQLLDAHPNEIIILLVNSYVADKNEANGMKDDPIPEAVYVARLLEDAQLTNYVFTLGDKYKKKDWPTLGELRRSNKRLIIISDDIRDGLDYVSLYRETTFELTRDQLLQLAPEEFRGGGRDLKGVSHFFLMNHFVKFSLPDDSMSGSLVYWIPIWITNWIDSALNATDYNRLNSYLLLMARMERAKQKYGMYPNILLIDFVDKGNEGGAPRAVYETNLLHAFAAFAALY